LRLRHSSPREIVTELPIAQSGGRVAEFKKSTIVKTEPMTIPLTPCGLATGLIPEEPPDLWTVLFTEAPPLTSP